MDWQALQSGYPKDAGYPSRAMRLTALAKVRDNTLYDSLPHPFSEEFSGSGEYISLNKRRPSVRTGLCRVVVDDSVSLLFSEGHWPTVQAKTTDTVATLAVLIKQTRLNEIMLDAATRGSVGSVAILMRVLSNKPFFNVMETMYLTPEWSPEDPDVLLRVTERFKVRGADLRRQRYVLPADADAQTYWFQRTWDETAETWFLPQRIDDTAAAIEDDARSTQHALGFVPIVWVRNLPGGDGPDGQCTFEAAIDTVIEGDYLLSQAGRGLNYSSDPKTVLTINGTTPDLIGGAANALVLPAGSDAKLLEIGGEAARAVLDHVRELRAIALEAMHGNRSHADKLSAATSGRSIELMMSGLIWLADRLRISYGESALLSLLRMACKASQVMSGGLTIGDERVVIDDAGLELRWPAWISPTAQDEMTTAQAVVTAYAGGVVSLKTAVTKMATLLGVDDLTAEMKLIETASAVKQQQASDLAAQTARNAANGGTQQTREVTA